MSAYDLMKRREYDAIIRERRDLLHSTEGDSATIQRRELAGALLRVGSLAHARVLLQKIVSDQRWSVADDRLNLGIISWIEGDQSDAISQFQQALKCQYGDGAQNMTPAMLLYYAAVRTNDDGLKGKSHRADREKAANGLGQELARAIGQVSHRRGRRRACRGADSTATPTA